MIKSDVEKIRKDLSSPLPVSNISAEKLDQSDYDYVEQTALGVYKLSPGNNINNLQCKATCKSPNSTPMYHISLVSNNVHEKLEWHG